MFVDKEILLDTVGTFTWFWGQDWLVETEHGNFHWKDPGYEGDNSFTLFNGSYDQFRAKTGFQYGRDKGIRYIREKCGEDIVLVFPQE